ncbi:MAG: leucyl aminopeptidase [Nannocystaceae bacterium]
MLRITTSSAPGAAASPSFEVYAIPAGGREARIESLFGEGVARAATLARFSGKAGARFSFTLPADGGLRSLLLLGAGDGLRTAEELRKLGFDGARAAIHAGAAQLQLHVTDALREAGSDALAHLAQGVELGTYRYAEYLSGDRDRPTSLEAATIHGVDADAEAISRGQKIAAAIARARDLVNGPAALVTPSFLAETAVAIAKAHPTVVATVLEREDCERLGMGCYLAVARGSAEPPKFIDLHYRPDAPAKGKICLVGKGVTFDSGGLSLKPTSGMFGMKMDMAGAATVLGALEGAASLGLPWEIHAIVAATENMPGRDAYRLGDVLRASNGKTVEIDNTDAEGRLTLADALTYAGRLEPDYIVDLATLTGACIVALGPHIAGVMGHDDPLVAAWLAASSRAGESMWRLPLPPTLKELLRSPIADMRNTGDRAGGAITAGLFLSEFTEGQRWIHVDIAGPGMVKKPYGVTDEGGSGFGVATILELLRGELAPASPL